MSQFSFCQALANSLALVLLLDFSALAGLRPRGVAAGFPEFRPHLVARLPGGYKAAVVDINRDTRPDIVGLATNPSTLAWYENPNWERHVLTSQAKQFIDLAPYDIDGDGRIDLAIAHEFGMSKTTSGGSISWLRCPEDPTREWALHGIGAEPTSHRIKWADVNADGRKELINAPIMGRGARSPLWDVGVRLLSYTIPDSPVKDLWEPIVIDNQLTVMHGITIVDWDGDGRDEVLNASFEGIHLYEPETGDSGIRWQKTKLASGEQIDATKRGSSEITVGKLRGEPGRFLATIEPWHGDKVVVYVAGLDRNGPWQRTVIDATFNEGHALKCADVDADGDDEIVAGYRGKGQSLYIYDCVDSKQATWKRIPLDEGDMAASGLDVADISGDGRLDIVCVGTATSNIKWYENLGPLQHEH
jgi:hypothetical protein